MLTCRIIPCLDSDKGDLVKGLKFKELRKLGSTVDFAARYEAEGADELVVLDISATLEDRPHWFESIIQIREQLSIPLTVGGGIRGLADCERALHSGADKVSLNTAAVHDPELVTELAREFGSQCVVVAIDAVSRGTDHWEITTHSGTLARSRSALTWAREVADRGAGELLLTSQDRDGSRSGYDTRLLTAVAQTVNLPLVASGGAATWVDFLDAYQAGANGLLAASIFHDKLVTINAIKNKLAMAGVPVRL